MLALDLVTLRLLLAVAREGSMQRAAQTEHIAASAISRRLNELEAALGLRLFERQPRGVSLTAAGRLVADYAGRILSRSEDLTVELAAFATGLRGELRIAASTPAIGGPFTPMLHRFVAEHPEIELRFQELGSTAGAAAVRDGTIDLAVIAGNTPLPGIEAEPFYEDPLWVVAPRGHPLLAARAPGSAVPLAEICRYDLLSLNEGGPMDELITRAVVAERGDRPRTASLSRIASLRRFVELGFGVGLLRASTVMPYLGVMAIEAAPIDDPIARQHLVIAHRGEDGLAPAPRLMLAHLRESARHLAPPEC